jgi:hypothetical protein
MRRKFESHIAQPFRRAHGRARDHAHATSAHVADHRVSRSGEPVRYSRIQNLVCRRIPAVLEHELARSICIGMAHRLSTIRAKLST